MIIIILCIYKGHISDFFLCRKFFEICPIYNIYNPQLTVECTFANKKEYHKFFYFLISSSYSLFYFFNPPNKMQPNNIWSLTTNQTIKNKQKKSQTNVRRVLIKCE